MLPEMHGWVRWLVRVRKWYRRRLRFIAQVTLLELDG
jgi:hypothetical protein